MGGIALDIHVPISKQSEPKDREDKEEDAH